MTLITRPRRFGKTLTMSMLEKFFSLDYAGRVGVRKTGTTLIRVSTVMGTLYRARYKYDFDSENGKGAGLLLNEELEMDGIFM